MTFISSSEVKIVYFMSGERRGYPIFTCEIQLFQVLSYLINLFFMSLLCIYQNIITEFEKR